MPGTNGMARNSSSRSSFDEDYAEVSGVELDRVFCLYFNRMRSYCESVDDIVRVLREHDVGLTRQRIVIAQVLFCRAQHLSADEVWERVNGQDPTTSRATVYNTLNLFSARGLIREVIAHPGKMYYDSNTTPHHHFYNVDTGVLTDIGAQEIEVSRLPALPDGMVAEGVQVIVRVRAGSGD